MGEGLFQLVLMTSRSVEKLHSTYTGRGNYEAIYQLLDLKFSLIEEAVIEEGEGS